MIKVDDIDFKYIPIAAVEDVKNRVTDFPEIRKTLEKELGYEINKRLGMTGVELFRRKLGIEEEE